MTLGEQIVRARQSYQARLEIAHEVLQGLGVARRLHRQRLNGRQSILDSMI
jgi:hypothetical protein